MNHQPRKQQLIHLLYWVIRFLENLKFLHELEVEFHIGRQNIRDGLLPEFFEVRVFQIVKDVVFLLAKELERD